MYVGNNVNSNIILTLPQLLTLNPAIGVPVSPLFTDPDYVNKETSASRLVMILQGL
jgi:hypothetical protein